MRVCPAIRANWERCQGIVGAGSDYCPAQDDPAREGARRRAASKAARNKSDTKVKGVKVAAPSPRRPRVVR